MSNIVTPISTAASSGSGWKSMVGGGLFNAFAFSFAGWVFKQFEPDKYAEETKRHNLAQEKLEQAKFEWNKKQDEIANELVRKKQELQEANSDIVATNHALDQLRKIHYGERVFTREPHLNDFYKPSQDMLDYQHVTMVVLGLGLGWGSYKLIKYLVKRKRS